MHLRFDDEAKPVSYTYDKYESVSCDEETATPLQLTQESFTFSMGDVEILVRGANDQVLRGKVCSQVMVSSVQIPLKARSHPLTLLMQCLASPKVWKKFIFPPFSQPFSLQLESWKKLTIREIQNYWSPSPSRATRFYRRRSGSSSYHFEHCSSTSKRYSPPISSLPYAPKFGITLRSIWLRRPPHGLCWPMDPKAREEWRKAGQFGWLWISFAFGKHFMFQHLATHLVKQVSVDEKDLFIPHTNGSLRYLLPEELPPGVEGKSKPQPMLFCSYWQYRIENTKRLRSQTIDLLISLIAGWIKPLTSDETQCLQGDKDCDALFYLRFFWGLCRLGLWPLLKPAKSTNMPLKGLEYKLLRLVTKELKIENKRKEQKYEREVKGIMALILRYVIRDCQKISMDRVRSQLMRSWGSRSVEMRGFATKSWSEGVERRIFPLLLGQFTAANPASPSIFDV